MDMHLFVTIVIFVFIIRCNINDAASEFNNLLSPNSKTEVAFHGLTDSYQK